MPETLSLLSEKPNLADGEEGVLQVHRREAKPGRTNKPKQDHHVKHPQPPLLHSPDNLLRA